MKSENCISQTGRIPTTAAPTAVPMIADSARGVSITRSPPNSSDEPVGDLEGAAEHADVLAHQEHALVGAHSSRSALEIACR